MVVDPAVTVTATGPLILRMYVLKATFQLPAARSTEYAPTLFVTACLEASGELNRIVRLATARPAHVSPACSTGEHGIEYTCPATVPMAGLGDAPGSWYAPYAAVARTTAPSSAMRI